MAILQRLTEDQERLEELLGRLSEMLEGEAPPPALDMFGLRCEIARLMFAHFQREDAILYPRLRDRPEPGVAALAEDLHRGIETIAAAYVAHIDKWDPVAIDRDWTGYRQASAILLRTVRERLAREAAELYPVLESLEDAA